MDQSEIDFHYNDTMHFSFFVQIGREMTTLRYVECILLGVTMIAGLIGNIVICGCLLSLKSLRRKHNYFIINLCLSSILYLSTGTFVVLARFRGTWASGIVSCQLLLYIQPVSGVVSMWTQMLISIERHQKIIQPFQRQLSGPQIILGCVLTWLLNLVIIYPEFHYGLVEHIPVNDTYVTICTIGLPVYGNVKVGYILSAYLIIFGYLIPFLFTVTCYSKVLYTVHKSHMKLQPHRAYSNGSIEPMTSTGLKKSSSSVDLRLPPLQVSNLRNRHLTISNRRHVRTIGLLITLICLYLVSWTPLIVSLGLVNESDHHNSPVTSTVLAWCIFVVFVGASLNPILFGCISDNFKQAIKRQFLKK